MGSFFWGAKSAEISRNLALKAVGGSGLYIEGPERKRRVTRSPVMKKKKKRGRKNAREFRSAHNSSCPFSIIACRESAQSGTRCRLENRCRMNGIFFVKFTQLSLTNFCLNTYVIRMELAIHHLLQVAIIPTPCNELRPPLSFCFSIKGGKSRDDLLELCRLNCSFLPKFGNPQKTFYCSGINQRKSQRNFILISPQRQFGNKPYRKLCLIPRNEDSLWQCLA